MIENITNIHSIDTSLTAAHAALSLGYWALGGAIGIAIMTILFNLFYKSKHLVALNKILEQNKLILNELKLLNKRKKK